MAALTYNTNMQQPAPAAVGEFFICHLVATVGASETYATGGLTLTNPNAALPLTIVSAIVGNFSNGYPAFYNLSTGKLQCFSSPGTELSNASAALENATIEVILFGYGH